MRLGCVEDDVHELFIIDLDPTVPISIQLLECFSHLFNRDTGPDESIKGDCNLLSRRGWPTTKSGDTGGEGGGDCRGFNHFVFLLDEVEELRGQIVSELFEGGIELSTVDRTGLIPVEVGKHCLPVLDVFIESGEFIESDGPAAIGIEYRHQELDGVKIKGSPVSVF